MKFFTANYSNTNHNFVIQNLNDKRVESKYLPAILIMKNILQRGKPTLMSKFLQSQIGEIQKRDDFNIPYTLISNKLPFWHHTIKGDEKNNYFPAKTFFEQTIKEYLPEFGFITQLIRPETPINEITQKNDKKFANQQVDFYFPQAFLVIEIDGQQHKTSDVNRISDFERDNHLALHNILTIRIDTKDLKSKTAQFIENINSIKQRLSEPKIARVLEFYKTSYNSELKQINKDILKTKLLPTAIIRFQILVLELLESGKISFDDKNWTLQLKQKDISNFAEFAINDLFSWFEHLFKLQKIEFTKPNISIIDFNQSEGIKIDFSLLERWTDENELNKNIIFVRTDYFDVYYDRVTKQNERISNFKLSTTKPYKYQLIRDEVENDLQHLEFFLLNIFGYNNFNAGQYPIIENALSRRDTIGLLPTGGGKSLTYQLTCLLQPSISFVVCPIKSLMYDQKKDLEDAYFQNIETISSDIKIAEIRNQILDNFGNGKYFFVFISPERFQTQDFRDRLSSITANYSCAYAVIDEVHCLSEWGHDFRTSYLNLSKTIRKYCGEFNFFGLTATASVNVLKDIQIEFNIKQEDVKTLIDYTRPELEFIVLKDAGPKYKVLKSILKEKVENENIFELNGDKTRCGLIFTPFVNGSFGCAPLANNIQNDFGIITKFYSGTKPNIFTGSNEDFDEYKLKVQNEFKVNKFPLLTATKAFGMGINKKNIDYTIHYGIPSSMEALYQEAGRAGRNRQLSECYVLLSSEDENRLKEIFRTDASYEDIANTIGTSWSEDVIRQIRLYQQGMEPIDVEFELIKQLHYNYSKPNSKKIINGNNLGTEKTKLEKAIYRLTNLGIIEDWTIENFFGGGIFTIYYGNFSDNSITTTLLKFIKKYEDDFNFDNKPEHIKYTQILNQQDKNTFEKASLILLHWSYDKFAYNRRQSLQNVYYNSLAYDDTAKGRENFKKSLEAYFKFTQATYILQHIAENNDKDFQKWFEIFYDENNDFISKDKLIELEGNLQRFLESYQNNTGLNLINALVILFLGKTLIKSHSQRFERALQTISKYKDADYDYIIDQILYISKQFSQTNKMIIVAFLQKITKSEEEFLRIAKELGDVSVVLEHYNTKLQEITKRFNNGLRKVG